MKKKLNNRVRKPNVVLFHFVYPFVKLYYRLLYKHAIDKSALDAPKPPFLVVAGHSCWLDYLITGISMYPIRMNYVAAYNFFRYRLFKTLFNMMGVIPKYQFTNDIDAIKKMKSVTDRGGVVAIFPNGCLSNDGRPGGFAVFGIAKLIKFLKVPVVAIKTDGGYLTRPRWTKHARYGKLETTVSQILSANETSCLSETEIYDKVTKAIAFDDCKWQRERMIPYRSRKPAEGLEYVLYKCPRCHSEFTLRSEGNRFFCKGCGNSVRMNRYFFFEPDTQDAVFFEGIDQWYDYQRECIEKETANPDFELTAETELRWAEPGKYGYQHLGVGTVRLTREAIIYTGTVRNNNETLVFPVKNIPMVPYAAGKYIEVARGSNINRFIFKDLHKQIKWVMAIRQIRDRYFEKETAMASCCSRVKP